jgi:hypothetical protein
MHFVAKRIIGLFICVIAGTGVVFTLFIYSQKINHQHNSFSRLFPPHFLSRPRLFELSFNSFYLAGFTNANFFLGNRTAAAFVLKLNYTLTDTQQLILKVPPSIPIVASAIRVLIDSPDIMMLEGLTPRKLSGHMNNLEMSDDNYIGPPFNAVTILSKKSLLIRTYDDSLHKNILIKLNSNDQNPLRIENILVPIGDGVFSLDGILSTDLVTGKMIYVYFYRNEFLSLDSNIRTLIKGHTIDSIKTPDIKISRIVSDNAMTFSAPPLMVNYTACANAGYLYVNSKLKAKNEDDLSFSENSVIDIYSLKTGEYIYSFYIPDHDHGKIKSFQVVDHKLVVLYDHSVLTFLMQF